MERLRGFKGKWLLAKYKLFNLDLNIKISSCPTWIGDDCLVQKI